MADYGDVPPFIIRELTGDKREVQLTGRALPYRPYPLKVRQRVEVEYLPGAGEGTATVLGPVDEPSTLNGAWKEKYLGALAAAATGQAPAMILDGGAVLGVRDAKDLFDSLCRMGQLLEVSWFDEVRHGFLEIFGRSWTTAKDLTWEMTFKWISRGEDIGPAVFTTITGLGDLAAEVRRRLSELAQIEVPEGFGIDFGFLDSLRDLQQGIAGAVQSVTDAVQQLTRKATTVSRVTRGIVATLFDIEEQCLALGGFVENQFGQEAEDWKRLIGDKGETGGIISGTPVELQTETQKLQARFFQLEVKQWAQDLRAYVIDQRTQLQQQLGKEVLQSYKVKAGQDLRDISQLAYGSAFEWRTLLLFNELPGIDVEPGTVVLVPKQAGPIDLSLGV